MRSVSSENCSRNSRDRFWSGRIAFGRRALVHCGVIERLVRLDLGQRLDAGAGPRLDLVDLRLQLVHVVAAAGQRDEHAGQQRGARGRAGPLKQGMRHGHASPGFFFAGACSSSSR
jgi:hypothetical protein